MPEQVAAMTRTCARCEVKTSWMNGTERPDLPANWVERDGEAYCLGCQREMAGEEGLAALPDGAPLAERQKVNAAARVDFEVRRDPSRANGKIAQACRTSIPSVRKARERLGLADPEEVR
jgi:hypothetical protein